MSTTNTYYDTESTYEVKTFTQTLTCGKCGSGQLLPIDLVADAGATVHACTHCGQNQAVEGEAYPRTLTRNVLSTTEQVKRTELIPDKDPDEYTAWEVSELTLARKTELLLTTRSPSIIDMIEKQTEWQIDRLTPIRNALYDMAREAACLRLITQPLDEIDQALTRLTLSTFIVDMAKVLVTTQREDVVEMIKGSTDYRLPGLPQIRKALFENARNLIALRAAAVVVSAAK